jgi:hypothetical protein
MRNEAQHKVKYKLRGTLGLDEKIFAWARNAIGDLTRAPMFGKSLPLDNNTIL